MDKLLDVHREILPPQQDVVETTAPLERWSVLFKRHNGAKSAFLLSPTIINALWNVYAKVHVK